jgi:predicted glycoside hydrolase/deacetylase ChbG (UPF0249 family)
LVDGRCFAQYAAELRSVGRNLALGLHLNFTSSTAPHRWPLAVIVVKAFTTGVASRKLLQQEIARQCDVFEQILGCAPEFVDGHQHVHQLPTIREPLLEELTRRYGTRVALRSTVPQTARGAKAALIASLGGKRFEHLARQRGFPTNRDFAGVYDFTTRVPYAKRMRAWLSSIRDSGLIMCHPQIGKSDTPKQASFTAEHAFLVSAEWQDLQTELKATLLPFTSETFTEQTPSTTAN